MLRFLLSLPKITSSFYSSFSQSVKTVKEQIHLVKPALTQNTNKQKCPFVLNQVGSKRSRLTLYSGWTSRLEEVLMLWAESLESCSISSRRGASGAPAGEGVLTREPPHWQEEMVRITSTNL